MILVTGGNGTMGMALREFLPHATYLGHADCDVTNDRQLNEVYQTLSPDTVIHAAALTDHQHPDAGEIIATNIIGTERVARYCKAFGAKMVYLSTHYVYPGKTGNYGEMDATKPIGTYAWSKLAGEGWAQTVPDWLIIRGSWYTYETRLRHWIKKGALTDAYCNREPARAAAEKIARLVRHGFSAGIYNIGGPRRTFADILAEEGYATHKKLTRAELHGLKKVDDGWQVMPVNPFDPPPLYAFPADSSVNTDKYDAFVAGP